VADTRLVWGSWGNTIYISERRESIKLVNMLKPLMLNLNARFSTKVWVIILD